MNHHYNNHENLLIHQAPDPDSDRSTPVRQGAKSMHRWVPGPGHEKRPPWVKGTRGAIKIHKAGENLDGYSPAMGLWEYYGNIHLMGIS